MEMEKEIKGIVEDAARDVQDEAFSDIMGVMSEVYKVVSEILENDRNDYDLARKQAYILFSNSVKQQYQL